MEIPAIIGIVTIIALLTAGIAFSALRGTIGILSIGAGVLFTLTTMGAIFAIPLFAIGGVLLWVEFHKKRRGRDRVPA